MSYSLNLTVKLDQKYLALGGFLKITISVFEDISQCLPDW